MKRLPPAPTNTALARLVRRMIDRLPWVMARDLRAARTDLARVRKLNSELRDENFDLRKDYDNLMHGSSLLPMPDVALLDLDFHQPEPVLILRVEYPRINAAVILRRNELSLSYASIDALQQAAERIARGMVRPHRDEIVKRVLGGKTIDQVIREKIHG